MVQGTTFGNRFASIYIYKFFLSVAPSLPPSLLPSLCLSRFPFSMSSFFSSISLSLSLSLYLFLSLIFFPLHPSCLPLSCPLSVYPALCFLCPLSSLPFIYLSISIPVFSFMLSFIIRFHFSFRSFVAINLYVHLSAFSFFYLFFFFVEILRRKVGKLAVNLIKGQVRP